ncbi:MAG: nucleotidyl transferase AbiEii/AbiGii toxin family protein [Candidatus ainarchaeum sp.]|nr:nucleotidyl transferase AbiEii/AbiGii toxin family protein [Candidatus ainarchaeum sp.]
MLTKNELIDLAKYNNLSPWQQEKHYLQSIALTALAQQPLIFKGGTYLWFFHGLQRFSEDLDFTAKETIDENIAKDVSKIIEMQGVENSYKITTQNDIGFSFRISAQGPLYEKPISACYLYVEISKRENILKSPSSFSLKTMYNLPIKIISGMALEEVVSEKVRAIMTRDKARDIFDLNFLIKEKNICFNESLIQKKLDYYNEDFSKAKFEKKLKEKKVIYKPELKSLVFNDLEKFEKIEKNILGWMG